MLHDTIANALNEQIELEPKLTSTSPWRFGPKPKGLTAWRKDSSTSIREERQHMLKLARFVNERGGVAKVRLAAGPTEYTGLKEIFESILEHETRVTECINNVVDLCLPTKDLQRTLHAVVRE